MRDCDLSDTQLAAVDSIQPTDSLRDYFLEQVAEFDEPLRSEIVAAFDRAEAERGPERTAGNPEAIVTGTLQAVYGDTRFDSEIRRIAAAALATLSRLPQSYQEIGDEFAVTRACIHTAARKIESKTGIKPRRAKSERARKMSAQAASGGRREPKRHAGNIFAAFPNL